MAQKIPVNHFSDDIEQFSKTSYYYYDRNFRAQEIQQQTWLQIGSLFLDVPAALKDYVDNNSPANIIPSQDRIFGERRGFLIILVIIGRMAFARN